MYVWGTHFKCGVDRIEKIMSNSGGFSLRDYFLNRKELEVKGHVGDSPCYTRTHAPTHAHNKHV